MSERNAKEMLINNLIEIFRSGLKRRIGSRERCRQLRESISKDRVSKMKSNMCKAVANQMQLKASRGNMTVKHINQLRRRKKRWSH